MPREFRNSEDRYRHVQGTAHRLMYPSIGELKWLWLVIAVVIVSAFVLGIFRSSEETESSGGNVVSTPTSIAFVSDRDGDAEIYVMNADGSGVVQLTDNEFEDGSPAWSPDGKRIAFVSDRDNDVGMYDIYVMNADGSGVEQLTDSCSNVHLSWSPVGDRIAFVSLGDIYVMNADGSGVLQLMGDVSESCAGVFWSDRDGNGVNEVYMKNADGSVEPFTDYESIDWEKADWAPSWSADGSRIAFQSYRDGDFQIYVMNSDGGGVDRLTVNEHGDWHPAWSPDGGRIAFTRKFDDHWDIYVMNADGSGAENLTRNDYYDFGAAWSQDGNLVAFSSDRDHGDLGMNGYEIYVMNVDSNGVVRLTDNDYLDYDPAWSPAVD